MKALFMIDVDALRRADLDPKAFVDNMRQVAMRTSGHREIYASGMEAGKMVWRGHNLEALDLKLDQEDVPLMERYL